MNGSVRSIRREWLDGERRPSQVAAIEHDQRFIDADRVITNCAQDKRGHGNSIDAGGPKRVRNQPRFSLSYSAATTRPSGPSENPSRPN